MQSPAVRCINIDWLELYVYEPLEGRDVEYYERQGYIVRDRGYGTKHWSQVFTLLDDRGDEFLEVRRAPRTGAQDHHTIYPDNASNLRLVNRYCYYDTAMPILYDFINRHGYQFRRIYRLDLALDLVKFDSGDMPRDVMRRISKHVYSKIYQARRSIHGVDRWNDCDDNSVSWGNKKSMVVTRFYNKSLELAEVKDKPWIRQAWYESGLIADPSTALVRNPDGSFVSGEVWRLEFQINSSARGWFVIDGGDKEEYVEHTMEAYWNRPRMMIAFQMLTEHYFQFRIFKQGVSKYDCKEKVLFKFTPQDKTYRLRNSLVRRIYPEKTDRWLKWLREFRLLQTDPDVMKDTDRLIARLTEKTLRLEGYQPDTEIVAKWRKAMHDWAIERQKAVSVDTARVSDIFDDENLPKHP